MSDALRSRRASEFVRRARSAPDSVLVHRSAGWRFIPIHPFGDDLETLADLGLVPGDCWSVDAWWEIEGDATLVQSCIARMAVHPPGLYARQTEHEEGWVYLEVVLEATQITREAFEALLSRFAAMGFPDDGRFRLAASAGRVRVSDPSA